MLVDQNDGNVFAVLCEAVKRLLNGVVLCLIVDNQEVLLRVWALRDVLYHHVLAGLFARFVGASSAWTCEGRTPTPASSKPVTESCNDPRQLQLSFNSKNGASHLVANDRDELAIAVCGYRCGHCTSERCRGSDVYSAREQAKQERPVKEAAVPADDCMPNATSRLVG